MSRNILAIVGILFCSVSAIGQDFVAPKNNPVIPPSNSGFQPPASNAFTPVSRNNVQIEEVKIQEPQIEQVPIIVPTKSENKATIQPVPKIKAVPSFQPTQSTASGLPTPQAPVSQPQQTTELKPLRPQPPMPEQNQSEQKPTVQQPTIQKPIVDRTPQSTINQSVPNQGLIELPQPKPEIETVQLKSDNETYRSSDYNRSGVSDYRLEVAREKARARRMRMEVKKWYGIDSARPVVKPQVDISVYSGYYNGIYSRYGYGNPYHQGASFYYHFPVGR